MIEIPIRDSVFRPYIHSGSRNVCSTSSGVTVRQENPDELVAVAHVWGLLHLESCWSSRHDLLPISAIRSGGDGSWLIHELGCLVKLYEQGSSVL